METFLGMQVEQSQGKICLHLDIYIREVLEEYKVFQEKLLLPKLAPIQPGLVLTKDDCPILPEPRKQKFIGRSSLSFNLLQYGFILIYRLQYHSWPASVHRRGSRIGLLFII